MTRERVPAPVRTLALVLLAALLAPAATASSPPLPDADVVDHGDGTYTLVVAACEPPVLSPCAFQVRLLPRAPGVFPTLHADGATVFTSLDCQHHLPTHGPRQSQCSSVSLSPTARAALRPTSDGWFYIEGRVCLDYTGWMCAVNGVVPVPDARQYPHLVKPYVQPNPDGSYTVGNHCALVMPWPVQNERCAYSVTVAPDFVVVTPRRTWAGVTTDVESCRAYAQPTPRYACTDAGEGPNAHVWLYRGPDDSIDPDVRVCVQGWWCPVNERVDLPKVLP